MISQLEEGLLFKHGGKIVGVDLIQFVAIRNTDLRYV